MENGKPGTAVVVADAVTRRYGAGDTAVDALKGVSLEVGLSSPARMCINVDLPEPDGPITAVSLPWPTSSEMPLSASTAVSPAP